MLKSFKYRIYPTDEQYELIKKHIDSCRFIYNLALETKQTAYIGYNKNLSCFDLIKQIPDLKKEFIWLKEINSQSLQQSVINLDKAFTSFFKGQNNYPNFKKKSSRKSFNIPQNIKIENNKLIIPKFKKGIDVVLHREIKGEIRQATISINPSGKSFVSILCETNEVFKVKEKIKESTTIGIDLGINDFLITSDAEVFNNPRFLKNSISKIKYIHRKLSKHNGNRTRKKLTLLHEKITNKRRDFLHKTSTKLINNHDTFCIEDLSIKQMMTNSKLSQSISDVGWGMFINTLKYKSEWYGKNIIQIGRFDPSSKLCSYCGKTNNNLTLNDRTWTCECGKIHNRDINAAINIKNFGLKKYLSMEHRLKNHDELPTLVGAMTHEAYLYKISSSLTL